MKTITKLSEEELLNLIENESEELIESDYHEFISSYNLKPGNVKIPIKLVKNLYIKWNKSKKTNSEFLKLLHEDFNIEKGYIFLEKSPIDYIENTKLLRNINKIDKIKSSYYQKHFEKYLKSYNIKRGNLWIKWYILNHFYDKWVWENKFKSKPLGFKNYRSFLMHNFEYKLDKNILYVKIDEEFVLNLNKEIVENIENAYQEKERKNRHQKRRSKTSIKSKK